MPKHPKNSGRTTGIEWTHHTWNPMVGCTICSAGCTNCYAMRAAFRLEHRLGVPSYAGTTHEVNGNPVWSGRINRSSDAVMERPLRIATPGLFFVNSMSDFWHPDAPQAVQAEAIAIMERAARHTFQILTKRPENIRPHLARLGRDRLPANVWLGATVEDGRQAARAPILAAVPAAVRFLSVEPLIGRVGFLDLRGIAQVITGGESGPGARECRAEWVREVRDQCIAADVAFFHKQWGTYRNNPLVAEGQRSGHEALALDPPENGKGGALLDGRLWRQIPPGAPSLPG